MQPHNIILVYDGECPICRIGVRKVEIEKTAGTLELVDARTEKDHPVMQEIKRRGIDLDEGMVAVVNGQYFHGRDAMHMLACISTPHGWLNRLNMTIFRSRLVCWLLYPFFKLGRRVALRFKFIPLLNQRNHQ